MNRVTQHTLNTSQYYPTPQALIREILSNLNNRLFTDLEEINFLEPCAGDGAICRAVKHHFENAKPIKVDELGMELDEWKFRSCVARCGVGEDWATVHSIRSRQEGKGHATVLLFTMKYYYEKQGLKFGGSVALNDRMCRLYQKCGVKEYTSKDMG